MEHGQTDAASASEERFERLRKTFGLHAAPALAVLIWFMPFRGLSAPAHKLASVLAFVVVLWVTEAIPLPVTALMVPVLCVAFGVCEPKQAFAPFADPIIFLFAGSFIIARAMFLHGLDRRFAITILGSRFVGGSPSRLLFLFGLATFFLSMWISNTAATAIMFPIGLSILRAMAGGADFTKLRYSTGLMLMASYASSLGGIATKIGTPPNLLGARLIEEHLRRPIPFFQWMLMALPIAFALFLFVCLYLSHFCPLEAKEIRLKDAFGERGRTALGAGERNVLIAAGLTAFLWMLPGVLALLWGTDDARYKLVYRLIPESTVALIGVVLLFVLPTDWKRRQFTITWEEAVKIDWGTVLLFGGGLSLGDLLFSTGLAEAMGKSLVNFTHAESAIGITFLFTALAAFVSEMTSNTASANMLVPIAIAMAKAAKVNPLLPALGATVGSSMGFMLPVSTPPNAIVYGSGCIPLTKMVKYGLLLDAAGIVVIFGGVMLLGRLVLV